MKMFQVSLRNRLLINQRPVQMVNGLYWGFKYLRRFRELSDISIPIYGTALLGVKWGFWETFWSEQETLGRREGRKIQVFRFLVGKEINSVVLSTSHYFWKEKKILAEFMVFTQGLLYFASVKGSMSQGWLSPCPFLIVDSFLRKGPRRDRASDRVKPPTDQSSNSDAIYRCCRPWNSEVR